MTNSLSLEVHAPESVIDYLSFWAPVLWGFLYSFVVSLLMWVVMAIYGLKTDKNATLGDCFSSDAAMVFVPLLGPFLAVMCAFQVGKEKLKKRFAPALRSNPFHPKVDEKYKDI